MGDGRSPQSAAMAPLRLLAAVLAAFLQLSFQQQINEGNNLVAVASHKLAAIKQQSQKQSTDSDPGTDAEDNLELSTEKVLDQVNMTTSAISPSGGSITSIKFVRNPVYDGPLPTFSIVNTENASDPIYKTVSYETALFNLSNALPTSEPASIATGQVANKQTEDNIGFVAKSPLFLSFAPQCSGALSSQSPYTINAFPTQSSISNTATLQVLPQSTQQLHQTVSFSQCQPKSVQNPTNMRMRFVPAQNTVTMQNNAPIQTAVPVQRTLPIQNAAPMQNTVPLQSAMDIQNIIPIQSTMSIPSTAPIHRTIQIQRTVPNVPLQNPMVQNPDLSVLLSHILSQSPVKQECSAPSNGQCASHRSKQTVVKTLLPLLLQLLTEKNQNCCEYKNKNERSRSYSRYKPEYKKTYDKPDTNFGIRSDVANQYHHVNHKRLKKPMDDILNDEDYSNESDYSDEEYDDED